MKAKKLKELNSEQVPRNTQKVLQWLLDPTEKFRGTGRTTQIMIALIELSIKYPGEALKFVDHYPYQPKIVTFSMISSMLYMAERMYPVYEFEVIGNLFTCRNNSEQ